MVPCASALLLTTALALAVTLPGSVAAQDVAQTGTARLEGKIVGADGKTPVPGATLEIYHLSTEKRYSAEPTGAPGGFAIEGLPYGYYDLAVRTADGLFIVSQVINLAPAGKTGINLVLSPFAPGEGGSARAFPGTDTKPVGIARMGQRVAGADFWRSPKGVAIIAGGAGVALLALSSGSDDNSPSD